MHTITITLTDEEHYHFNSNSHLPQGLRRDGYWSETVSVVEKVIAACTPVKVEPGLKYEYAAAGRRNAYEVVAVDPERYACRNVCLRRLNDNAAGLEGSLLFELLDAVEKDLKSGRAKVIR